MVVSPRLTCVLARNAYSVPRLGVQGSFKRVRVLCECKRPALVCSVILYE